MLTQRSVKMSVNPNQSQNISCFYKAITGVKKGFPMRKCVHGSSSVQSAKELGSKNFPSTLSRQGQLWKVVEGDTEFFKTPVLSQVDRFVWFGSFLAVPRHMEFPGQG